MLLAFASLSGHEPSASNTSAGCQGLNRTIVREFYRGELTSTVGAKCLQLEAGLTLCPLLDVLYGSRCTILGMNHGYPHVPAEIIHKQQKVLVTPWRC
jgi:hypothetical protein